jgi:phage terminase large subunit
MFDCSVVFDANNNSKAKVNVNQGGTSSGKTYSIIQVLFLKAISEPRSVITIVGQDIPNLKKGAYRDAETIYNKSEELKSHILSWNKTDRIIYFKNNSIIEFNSYDDQQDAKNGKRDYLFVNEANGIDYLVYWQLAIRTRKQIFIDYNPSAPFWVHDNLIGTEGVQLFISDHRHNPFLTKEDHDKIENIKDPELWRVYARGMTGNITGIIFPDWQKIPDSQYPWDEPCFGGLDFGYTNDPTAAVRISRIGETLYVHEIAYTPAITPANIKQLFFSNGFTGSSPIYCEHDPDQVSQLRRLQVLALPARKGQGSINAGIQKLKEFKVYYTASSTNLDNERSRYKWITDPTTGRPTNTPIDNFNHLMDAIRYGAYTHYFSGR